MDLNKLSDKELIDLAKQGDSKAIETLVEKYKYIPVALARSNFLLGGDQDDLIQEGTIAVYTAINSYDEQKSSFKTFLYTCVKNRINSVIKKSKAKKNLPLNSSESLFEYFEIDNDKNKHIQDKKFQPEEQVINKETETEIFHKIKADLSKTEYKIFEMFINGFTYVQMSEELGKPIKSVDNAVQRMKRKIAKIFNI